MSYNMQSQLQLMVHMLKSASLQQVNTPPTRSTLYASPQHRAANITYTSSDLIYQYGTNGFVRSKCQWKETEVYHGRSQGKDMNVSSHCRADHGCSCIHYAVDDREASLGRNGPLQHSNSVKNRMRTKSFVAETPCCFGPVKYT